MKITVIGRGDGFPESTEAVSGYLVEKEGTVLLLHAGSGVAAHVQQYISIHDIHHIIHLHHHNDYEEDVLMFMQARKIARQLKQRDEDLSFYSLQNKEIVKEIRRAKYSRFYPVTDNSQFELGPFTIDFHRTSDTVETYALRVRDDTAAMLIHTPGITYDSNLVRFAFGVDLLIVGLSTYGGDEWKAAGQLAAKCDATVTMLPTTHHHALGIMSDSIRQQLRGEMRLAKPGMILTI